MSIAQSAPPSSVETPPQKSFKLPDRSQGVNSPTHSDSTNFTGLSSAATSSLAGAHQRLDPRRGSITNVRLATFTEDEESPEVLPLATSLEQLAANYAKLREEGFKNKRGQMPLENGKREEPQPDRQADAPAIPTKNGKISPERQESKKSSSSVRSAEHRASPPRVQRVAVLSQRAYSKSPALDDRRKAEKSESSPKHGRSTSHGASNRERSSGTPDSTPPKKKDSSSSSGDSLQEQRRGRSRFQTAEDAAEAAKAARKELNKSKQRSRSAQSSQPPIDLSQFQVIEEYTCETCPVHGSRSNSRVKDKQNPTPAASTQPRYRPGSAREHRSNMPPGSMNATPHKAQAGMP